LYMKDLQGSRIMLTGATGFVGSALLDRLLKIKPGVRVALRREVRNLPAAVSAVHVGEIGPKTNWHHGLAEVEVIIHLAARVHVPGGPGTSSLAEFRRTNVAGTLNLARQAARAGVRRFVFISSIKVNGESTSLDRPYRADDLPAPLDSYGISKREAEEGLQQLASETGMEVVIIRPPLVYGPGVKANFLTMMRWLYRRLPMPFGAVPNKRTLVAVDNLVELIITCIDHAAAADQIFLAGDGEDLSTTELLRRLGRAMGRPARLVPMPARLLEAGAAVLGRRDLSRRLCDSLLVDISKARTTLGWNPSITIDEALQTTVQHFLENAR
jgi:nucleoside-diphosphate-sugar epimerase